MQFIHEDKKILFLIRNGAYFNPNKFSEAPIPSETNNGRRTTYLYELSKINHNIEFPTDTQPQEDNFQNSIQLTLNFAEVKDELEQLKSEYDEFHILTYKIDHAYQIYEIKHYLPNPENNMAIEIEDLSKYISGAELTDEEREVVAPVLADDLIDAAAFDIGIEEEEKSK